MDTTSCATIMHIRQSELFFPGRKNLVAFCITVFFFPHFLVSIHHKVCKKKFFAEYTQQSWKNGFPSAHFSSFAECCDHGTWQRGPLPSATLGKVTQNGNF